MLKIKLAIIRIALSSCFALIAMIRTFTPFQQKLLTGLLVFFAGWALLQTLEFFKEFVLIFSSAGIIAFLLNYPVKILQRYVPRALAALMVYSVFATGGTLLTLTLVPSIFEQASQLGSRLPEFFNSAQGQFTGLENWLIKLGLPVKIAALQEALFSQIEAQIQGFAQQAVSLTLGTVFGLIELILVVVISFYMLLEGDRFWNGLIGLLPAQVGTRLTESLEFNLRGFFSGQLVLGVFMAGILLPIFVFLGVPYALLFSLFIGVMELVPFIGASLGIGAVVLLLVLQNSLLAFKVLIACLIIQQIKDNVLAPRILGNFTGLNPVLIFAALILGGKIGGLLGVILAIPLTGVVKSILEVLYPDKFPSPIVQGSTRPELDAENAAFPETETLLVDK
jgi:predicted PurR-regulated permease PerM